MCAAVLDDITSRSRCPGERNGQSPSGRALPAAMTPDKKKFLFLRPISHADKTNWRNGAIEFRRVSLTLHCPRFAAQSATTRCSQLPLKQCNLSQSDCIFGCLTLRAALLFLYQLSQRKLVLFSTCAYVCLSLCVCQQTKQEALLLQRGRAMFRVNL